MIYFLAAVAAIAGLLFGYDEGVIAVASPSLEKTLPMSALQSGFMTASVPLGALIGAIAAGRLTERFGRRRVLMAGAVVFTIAAVGESLSQSVEMLMVARFVLGMAIGVAAVIAPMYISETAPLRSRGGCVATYQLAITMGILLSYMMGLAVQLDGAWRVLFALGAVPGVVFLLALAVLPESPRWLMLHGHEQQAAANLARLRIDPAEAEAELAEIRTIATVGGTPKSKTTSITAAWLRPALIVGAGLFFLQQLSGINAVIYYAPSIFSHMGLSATSTQALATVGVGLVNFLVTIVAMFLVDRWGRRPLLVVGFSGAALTLALIAVATLFPGVVPSSFLVIALFAYIASFAISLGPLPHVMMSEIFPLSVRGQGMSIASCSNWGFNFVVVFLFPLLLSSIGLAGTFGLFAAICFGGILFTLAYVPETRDVSLEKIEEYLRAGKPLRTLRVSDPGASAPAA